MNFTEQFLSPCLMGQFGSMKVGKTPALTVLEDIIKRAYVDGWNSGERSATYLTEWHPMSCEPSRVIKPEFRNGKVIDILLLTEEGFALGKYDLFRKEFIGEGVAWKYIDMPDMRKIYDKENNLWLENISDSETT